MPTTSNFGWTTPADTDLVKDGALAIRTLGNGIDTSMAELKGGTTGQILSKTSNTDMDFTWINNDQGDITAVNVTSPITGGGTSGAVTISIQDGTTTQKGAVQLENSVSSTSTTTAAVPAGVKTAYDLANAAIPKSTVTTNGDLIYGTGSATVTRLGIGSSGQVLTVSGGIPAWTTPASSSPTFSGARAYKSGSQSLSTSTWTTVTFDSESFDTDGYHSTSTNTSRMTIPTGKSGYFLLIASFEFDANTTGRRIAPLWRKNGADAAYGNIYIANTGSVCSGSSSTILAGSAGDYFEFQVWQNSGGNLDLYGGNLSTSFQIQFLGA